MLEGQADTIATISSELQTRPSPINIAGTSPQSQASIPSTNAHGISTIITNASIPFGPWPFLSDDVQAQVQSLPPMTIPVKHKTSSSYLLSLPAMKALIGEYPRDLFFLLESRNQLPSALSFGEWSGLRRPPHIDETVTDFLVSAFFSTAHHWHPILDQEIFQNIYSAFLMHGIDSSIETALCLVVCALGAVATTPVEQGQDFKDSPPGMDYIQYAMPILISQSSWSFSYSILLPQALVLASLYFAYLVRPLQSWRLIYSASTILQFKLSGYVNLFRS